MVITYQYLIISFRLTNKYIKETNYYLRDISEPPMVFSSYSKTATEYYLNLNHISNDTITLKKKENLVHIIEAQRAFFLLRKSSIRNFQLMTQILRY